MMTKRKKEDNKKLDTVLNTKQNEIKDNYVFISYSSKNQQVADSVRLLLIEQGVSCWMVPYDIPAGSRYAYVINDALENCSCLLLLLTNASQMSQFVEREIERAITYKKPILPMQLEDLELNSGFKFYIGNSQIIAVPEVKGDSPEFCRILSGLRKFLNAEETGTHETSTIEVSEHKGNCKITVFSPVNVDVYSNDTNTPVLKIDRNTGFDYQSNSIVVGKQFDLVFVAKGFEKRVSFETPCDEKLEYRLGSILSPEEISASFERSEAIKYISKDPTGYAFEQIAIVGESEDIDLLHGCLKSLASSVQKEDHHKNYMIACCAVALGKLCIKWHLYEASRIITKVYDKYDAKSSYGYMFENIMRNLSAALDDKFLTVNQELVKKAEDGDAEAQFRLAEKYYDKTSVFMNNKKAFQWFLEAAKGGNIQAMLKVASLYYVGLGCEKDTAKEQYWYRCAMEAGSTAAIYLLARALDHGYLDHGRIGKNAEEKAEALELYKKASECGYVEASKDLAFHYLREHDDYSSMYWFRVAAEQGDSEGQLYYAKCLFYGSESLEFAPQHENAILWYQKAAEQNDCRAQYALARCYFYGSGIKQDYEKAFYWCEKAALQKLGFAQMTLSILYGRGFGTEQDSNKSEYWYRIANHLEDADAYKKNFFKQIATLAESYPVFDESFDW